MRLRDWALAALLFPVLGMPLSAHAVVAPELIPLGTTPLFSDPSCASDTVGSAVCAAVGQGRRLIVDHFTFATKKWSGWVPLTGNVSSAPSCFRLQGFLVWCGVRDDMQRLVIYGFNGSTWSAPEAVGGVLTDAPSCVPLDAFSVMCTSRYVGGNLFTAVFKGKGFGQGGTWNILGLQRAAVYSPISCAANVKPLADAYCAWIGNGGGVLTARFIGQTLSWQLGADLGGFASGQPQCFYDGETPSGADPGSFPDHMGCFFTELGGALYAADNYDFTDFGSNAGPNDWTPLRAISYAPDNQPANAASGGCISYTLIGQSGKPNAPQVGCAMTGDDPGDLLVTGFPGAPSYAIAGTYVGTPSCYAIDFASQAGQAMCVVRNSNNTAGSIDTYQPGPS